MLDAFFQLVDRKGIQNLFEVFGLEVVQVYAFFIELGIDLVLGVLGQQGL